MTAPTIDKSRVTELRKAAEGKAVELEGMAASWAVEDGGELVISTEQKDAYLKASNEAKDIGALLQAAEGTATLRTYLDTPEGTSAAAQDAIAGQLPQYKTLGQAFLASPDYRAAMESKSWHSPNFGMQMDYEGSIWNEGYGQKDIYGGGYPGMIGGNISLPALGTLETRPIIEIKRRQSHVRDLFPKVSTTAALIYGVRETGYTNAAAQVASRTAADGTLATGLPTDVYGLKPKSALTFEPYTIPISTIATLIDAHRNILADEPRLQDFLDRRLREGLMFAEDIDLLWSIGGAERITGLFRTAGIQVYPTPGTPPNSDKRSVQLRRAATRIMLAEYEPTGVVLHPLDWEAIETETITTGALFVAVSVAIGAEKRVWRMSVVDTSAMTEGNYLLGAWGSAANYYERESVQVTVSTENRDNYERNVITMRAEMRGALAVDRPEAICHGTFYAPTP